MRTDPKGVKLSQNAFFKKEFIGETRLDEKDWVAWKTLAKD